MRALVAVMGTMTCSEGEGGTWMVCIEQQMKAEERDAVKGCGQWDSCDEK